MDGERPFSQHAFMRASANFPSLQSLCEASLAKLVDAHNFADILAYGEALNCTFLSNYCKKFLLLNLDAILAASRPRELGILRFQTSVGMIGSEHEEEVLEFFEENNSNESPRLHPAPPPLPLPTQQAKLLCSKKPTTQSVRAVMRRVKGIRKKLMQICKLEEEKNKELTVEQKMKIQRKSTLSDELKELEAWLELSPDLVAVEENERVAKKNDSVKTRSDTKEQHPNFNYRKG